MPAIAWATLFDMNQYDLSLGEDVSTSASKELAIMLFALFKAVVFWFVALLLITGPEYGALSSSADQ